MEIWTAISGVFTAVFIWLVSAVQSVLSVLWVVDGTTGTGSLTVLGVLAVVALAISVFFLILGLIQKFFHFRG